MRTLGKILALSPLLLLGIAILFPLTSVPEPSSVMRDYCVERGPAETGARNLVSAIYLGWRAYDTLGETIVLLLAVTGAVFLLRGR